MKFIEERLYDLISNKAKGDRLIIKIDELVAGLKESRGPIYNALKALAKKGKIETRGRGKKGTEIHLLELQKKSNSFDGSTQINNITTESKEIIPPKITLKEISDILKNAPLDELETIRDLVELRILNKKQKK